MQIEGIYRVNGNQADIGLIEQKVEESEYSFNVIQNLCLHNMFDWFKNESRFSSCATDPQVELAELGVGVHAVTGALKSFLKLLPEPIIPGTYQSAFRDAMSKLLNEKMLALVSVRLRKAHACVRQLFYSHTPVIWRFCFSLL